MAKKTVWDKHAAEQWRATTSLGVVAALRKGVLGTWEATRDWFDLDTYRFFQENSLCQELLELHQWGMELDDVAEISPKSLEQSYCAIERLALRILENPRIFRGPPGDDARLAKRRERRRIPKKNRALRGKYDPRRH
jgi:hypothetical protein